MLKRLSLTGRLPSQWLLARLASLASVAAWTGLLILSLAIRGDMRDAGAYFTVDLDDIYASSTFLSAGYVYSPAFAVLTEPFRWLPPEVLETVIRTTSTVALGWLVTPSVGLALIVFDYPGLRAELGVGNIDLVVAATLVLVLRKPALWSTLLLTKVTPGVGIAWHVARQDWKALRIIAIITVSAVVLSLPFVGIESWVEWLGVLTGNNLKIADESTGWPLLPRMLIGSVLAGMAGFAGWPWVLPLAVAISFADPNVAHWLVILATPRLWLYWVHEKPNRAASSTA